MAKFEVGDKAQIPGVPIVVEVLEIGTCAEVGCEGQTFRFSDPESGEDDWMHADEFVKVGG